MKLLILILLTAASSFAQQKPWRQILTERLPYFGDGNWIVVADSAFPLRSAPGVEMIISDDSQLDTVRHLLGLLAKDGRLRPTIYTDNGTEARAGAGRPRNRRVSSAALGTA